MKPMVGEVADGIAVFLVEDETATNISAVLPGAGADLMDAGTSGDYYSVIGIDKVEPMRRFVIAMVKGRFAPSMEEATLSGV